MRSLFLCLFVLLPGLLFAGSSNCRNPLDWMLGFYVNSKTGCDDGCPQKMVLSGSQFDMTETSGFMLEACNGNEKYLDTYHGKISQGGGTYDFISAYSDPSTDIAWGVATIRDCNGDIIGYIDTNAQAAVIAGAEIQIDFLIYDSSHDLIGYVPSNQDQLDSFNIYDSSGGANLLNIGVISVRSQTAQPPTAPTVALYQTRKSLGVS